MGILTFPFFSGFFDFCCYHIMGVPMILFRHTLSCCTSFNVCFLSPFFFPTGNTGTQLTPGSSVNLYFSGNGGLDWNMVRHSYNLHGRGATIERMRGPGSRIFFIALNFFFLQVSAKKKPFNKVMFISHLSTGIRSQGVVLLCCFCVSQMLTGRQYYAFGDHGGVLVAVRQFAQVDTFS